MQRLPRPVDSAAMADSTPSTDDLAHYAFRFTAKGVYVTCLVSERVLDKWHRVHPDSKDLDGLRRYARMVSTRHVGRQTANPNESWQVRIDGLQIECARAE